MTKTSICRIIRAVANTKDTESCMHIGGANNCGVTLLYLPSAGVGREVATVLRSAEIPQLRMHNPGMAARLPITV